MAVSDYLGVVATPVEVIHERHIMGLFPRSTWLELIGDAGFEPFELPFERDAYGAIGNTVFLGIRTASPGGESAPA